MASLTLIREGQPARRSIARRAARSRPLPVAQPHGPAHLVDLQGHGNIGMPSDFASEVSSSTSLQVMSIRMPSKSRARIRGAEYWNATLLFGRVPDRLDHLFRIEEHRRRVQHLEHVVHDVLERVARMVPVDG